MKRSRCIIPLIALSLVAASFVAMGVAHKVTLLSSALNMAAVALVLFSLKRNPDWEKKAIIKSQSTGFRQLLPPVFRWVGFGIAVAGVVLLATVSLPETPDLLWGVIMIGLSVAMFSRERNEDELLREIRLTSAWSALAFGALMFCFIAMIPLENNLTPELSLISAMLFYHLLFTIQKRRIRHEEHD